MAVAQLLPLGNNPSNVMSNKDAIWKAVKKGDADWQLNGESVLRAELHPKRPKANEKTVVRLTHSNSLGRFADADYYVRIGDPLKPTDESDLDSATDWVRASLVEDLIWIDDVFEGSRRIPGYYMLHSDKTKPLEESSAWSGTYECVLSFPRGKHSVEIKILSGLPDIQRSMVFTGWDIAVK